MFPHYRFVMLSCICMLAALVGQVFAPIVGSAVASMIGTWAGMMYGVQADEVSKKFKTDVERILEPDDNAKAFFAQSVVFGLLAAFAWGSALNAPTGAVVGIIAMLFVLKKMMGL